MEPLEGVPQQGGEQQHVVIIWDLDETLVLFQSLCTGAYAAEVNGSLQHLQTPIPSLEVQQHPAEQQESYQPGTPLAWVDPQAAHLVGQRLTDCLFNLLDQKFLYNQVEFLDPMHLSEACSPDSMTVQKGPTLPKSAVAHLQLPQHTLPDQVQPQQGRSQLQPEATQQPEQQQGQAQQQQEAKAQQREYQEPQQSQLQAQGSVQQQACTYTRSLKRPYTNPPDSKGRHQQLPDQSCPGQRQQEGQACRSQNVSTSQVASPMLQGAQHEQLQPQQVPHPAQQCLSHQPVHQPAQQLQQALQDELPTEQDHKRRKSSDPSLLHIFERARSLYMAGFDQLPLTAAERAQILQVRADLNNLTQGWPNQAQALLHDVEQEARQRGCIVHQCIVTTGQLVATLGKLMLFDLGYSIQADMVYSASKLPKLTVFSAIQQRFGPSAAYLAVGDGNEERCAAASLGWPFLQISLAGGFALQPGRIAEAVPTRSGAGMRIGELSAGVLLELALLVKLNGKKTY